LDAEYSRARKLGYFSALDVLERHGRPQGESNARALMEDARKRGSDEFDRGYALGYQDALKGAPPPPEDALA